MTDGSKAGELRRLIGVYHADGGVLGELRYVAGKLTGRTHCALCDVTHGRVRAKDEWTSMCTALPVAIECVHLNQRTPAVFGASDGHTPCVLADVDGELVMLMGPDAIESCAGEVSAFRRELQLMLETRGLAVEPPNG